MKKYLCAAVVPVCLLILASCKKENQVSMLPETSNQVLTKISQYLQLNNNSSGEVISYQYNDAGKLTGEGDKKYLRDDQQRIVEVLDNSSVTNRNNTIVYYSKANPKQVAYTLSEWSGVVHGSDSIVYNHDESGLLTKTMTYIRQPAGIYLDTVNYYQYTLPDTTYLSKYTVFKYDTEGNITDLSFFSINIKGHVVLCGKYTFDGYSKTINPQYSDDEVRMADYSFYGTMNVSKNNFTTTGNLSKSCEYRADGRPRSCAVNQNGVKAFTLKFEYK